MLKADIGKIVNEAIRITRKNKWLWIFAFVIVATSGSGFNNLSNLGDEDEKSNTLDKNQQQKFEQLFKKYNSNPALKIATPLPLGLFGEVLGSSTIKLDELFSASFPYLFILAIIFLLLVILGVAVSLYSNSWASAALVDGINLENEMRFVSLTTSSAAGRVKAFEVLKIKIIPGILLSVVGFLAFIPLILIIAMLPSNVSGLILLISMLILVPVLIVASISVAAASSLGAIAVVLENLDWKSAFKRGLYVFKKYFFDVLVMWVVNCFAGIFAALVSCVVLIPLAMLVGLAALVGTASPSSVLILFPLGFIVGFALVNILFLVTAVITVFSKSTWVLLYKQLVAMEVPNAAA